MMMSMKSKPSFSTPSELLLEHLALLVPVGGRGIVGHLHLDGEGHTGSGQLRDGSVAVLLGLRLVEELGDVGQVAALEVVHAVGVGTEAGGRDGVQLVVVVASGALTASVTELLMP